MVYLLRFSHPIGTPRHSAQYYLGYCHDAPNALEARLELHRAGAGARITAAAVLTGADLQVVHTWPNGDRALERRLKRRKSHARILAGVMRNG